jgi:hypothetical protein
MGLFIKILGDDVCCRRCFLCIIYYDLINVLKEYVFAFFGNICYNFYKGALNKLK